MKDFEFPTPPEPKEVPFYRRIPSVYYWWFGAVFFLGLTIIWLPSQCTLDYLDSTEVTDELQGFPKVDQDKELNFAKTSFGTESERPNPSPELRRPFMTTERSGVGPRCAMAWPMA